MSLQISARESSPSMVACAERRRATKVSRQTLEFIDGDDVASILTRLRIVAIQWSCESSPTTRLAAQSGQPSQIGLGDVM